MKKHTPPVIGTYLLSIFIRYSDHDTVIGDFEEIYHELRDKHNKVFAFFWYYFQILKSSP